MKAFSFSEFGAPADVIKAVDLPVPEPGPGIVRVKVVAASLNPVDSLVSHSGMTAAGWYTPLPFTTMYDLSGVVDAVGAEVADFKVGDDVFCVNWGQDSDHVTGKHDDKFGLIGGACAEYACVPACKLSKKPAAVSHTEAAAVALVGTTAYQALDHLLGGKSGARVLVIGGSSSVGQMAVQIAKLRGAWVATTCSARTKDFVSSVFKPDLLIDYTQSKWDETPELLGTLDAVFVTVGEPNAFARARDSKIVRQGGTFLAIAGANVDVGFDPKAHEAEGFSYAAWFCLENDPAVQDELARLVAEKKLTVCVDQTYPFTAEGVAAAFAKLESGKSIGKNVVTMK